MITEKKRTFDASELGNAIPRQHWKVDTYPTRLTSNREGRWNGFSAWRCRAFLHWEVPSNFFPQEVVMATPRDPNQQKLNDELERRRLERRSAGAWRGGGWFYWWWAWLVIIIAIIWFGGWGWGGYGGWWWGGRSNAATVQGNYGGNYGGNYARNGLQGPTGEGVAILNSTDKQSFVGKPFAINDVQIQNKVNDQVLWIGGANNSATMLVVLNGPGNSTANANVGGGDHVNITGNVEKAPTAAQAKQTWHLSDDAAKQLEQQGVYVQASNVQKVQQPQ